MLVMKCLVFKVEKLGKSGKEKFISPFTTHFPSGPLGANYPNGNQHLMGNGTPQQ